MLSSKEAELTQEKLKSLLYYSKDTGLFFWRNQRRPAINPWDQAGNRNVRGYVQLTINQFNYLAHRLAWLYVNGEWPSEQIDHIDTDKSNNRWANLREATASENQQNQRSAPKSKESSRLLGVSWSKASRKWTAQIKLNGKKIYLGLFDSEQAAHEAYVAAKREIHAFGML